MARRPLSDRLADERGRVARAQDRLRALKAGERKAERAKSTHRKVLLGALMMDELASGGSFAAELKRWLGGRLPDTLTRGTDRALMAGFMDSGKPAEGTSSSTDEDGTG